MIETLESRTLFSVTPQAALVTLREDVAAIGTKIKTMIAADAWAIKVLHRQIPDASDTILLQEANLQFNTYIPVLEKDFTVTKSLLGQDITRLINVTDVYNRHPTVELLAQRVITAEQIITAQGESSVAALAADTNALQTNYIAALAPIPAAHPVNGTLAVSVGDIATSFDQAFAFINTTAQTISTVDIPDFISALEPAGVQPGAA